MTAIAIIATFTISFSSRIALGLPIDWLAWIECSVIPVTIGLPISLVIFSQSEKLKESNDLLAKSRDEVNQANEDLRVAYEQLTHISRHDQMTGLLNREYFMEMLEVCIDENANTALLIIDADHFKQVNDRFGHLIGDEALRKISKALRYAVRRDDIVARIGGEEFAVLLADVFPHEAESIAEIVRKQIEIIPWKPSVEDASPLTVSIGGTHLMGRYKQPANALREADRCLYEAKKRGRNRVSFASSSLIAA